jgi:hypothetical protein
MSPELELLDQLFGGDMPLQLVRSLFADHERFERAVSAMIGEGELRLFEVDGSEVPGWRQSEILRTSDQARLQLTEAGARRIR